MGDAELSKLLFEARELIEMLADIQKARTGESAAWPLRVVSQIDAYRAERGWNPHGFGGEE